MSLRPTNTLAHFFSGLTENTFFARFGVADPPMDYGPVQADVVVTDEVDFDYLWDVTLRVLRRANLRPDRQDRVSPMVFGHPVVGRVCDLVKTARTTRVDDVIIALTQAAVRIPRMFGITAGYHRYFAHRRYKTSRVFAFLLAFLAQSSAERGVLWWAGNQRG